MAIPILFPRNKLILLDPKQISFSAVLPRVRPPSSTRAPYRSEMISSPSLCNIRQVPKMGDLFPRLHTKNVNSYPWPIVNSDNLIYAYRNDPSKPNSQLHLYKTYRWICSFNFHLVDKHQFFLDIFSILRCCNKPLDLSY